MKLTIEISGDEERQLNHLSSDEQIFYKECLHHFASAEVGRLVAMTDAQRLEHIDFCRAVWEGEEQVRLGQTLSWEQGQERTRREMEVERASGLFAK